MITTLFKDKDFEITQTAYGNKILWIEEKDRTVSIAFMRNSTEIDISDTDTERELKLVFQNIKIKKKEE